MNNNSSSASAVVKEPLFHITRRRSMSLGKAVAIRAIAIIIGLIICGIIISASSMSGKSFFEVFSSLWRGCFGTERKLWIFLQKTALLLGVSLALVVAFKMKFWNLGGNGQILVGCLASAMCLYYLGGKLPDGAVWAIMIASSLLIGAIWAVIPAIFKAFFRTNESLFTLMMNYIAICLVKFFIKLWYPNGTGAMSAIDTGALPAIGSTSAQRQSLLTIIVVVAVTVFMIFYLKRSKHGYEISVVGDSENTALYAGISVKKVMIRTLAISGALCGLIGLLLTGSINHTVSDSMDENMGFTGIMVAWLAKFNPVMMILTSVFITFVTVGMKAVNSDFSFSSEELGDIVIGIIYFLIIACEFFISYQLTFKKDKDGNDLPVIAFFKGVAAKIKAALLCVAAFFKGVFLRLKAAFSKDKAPDKAGGAQGTEDKNDGEESK